jgi:hypothetical protein
MAGVQEAICAVLKIPDLRHTSALMDLGRRGPIPAGSVVAAYTIVQENWRRSLTTGQGSRSRQNWRSVQPALSIAAHNRSPEVVLERSIAAAVAELRPGKWWVQMPMVSGMAGPNADRRRAIDLVHRRDDGALELIELKVASDTPLYAAYEIIGSACLWLLSRQAAGQGAASPLLVANSLHVRVLAPAAFYRRFGLNALERQLDRELRVLGEEHGVALGFGFDLLPERLLCDALDAEEICTLLDARTPL